MGERLLSGSPFRKSDNDYDWLGPGVYFWEANPFRAFEFAQEASVRKGSRIRDPFVVGAVLDLRLCFDLITKSALSLLPVAFEQLKEDAETSGSHLPKNSNDLLRRNLDCAVIRRVHSILEDSDSNPIDTIKGVFTEGDPVYPGAGFCEKTNTQLAVCNLDCIRGVFRVAPKEYSVQI